MPDCPVELMALKERAVFAVRFGRALVDGGIQGDPMARVRSRSNRGQDDLVHASTHQAMVVRPEGAAVATKEARPHVVFGDTHPPGAGTEERSDGGLPASAGAREKER
jgi:hypothetical protein